MPIKLILLVLAPLIFLLFAMLHPLQASVEANCMTGIVIWMAVWWFSECVHLAVTSLLPIVLIPLCGIADVKDVSEQYGNSIIFLFLGGFLISIAIEKWDLHKRVARGVMKLTGNSITGVLAGIMLSTFLLSNWISNTATALMLFGAILALINELENALHKEDHQHLSAALMLGMAYAASIGGMATPVGTPPNMYFFKAYPQFHQATTVSFVQWLMWFMPLSLIILTGCFFILKFLFLDKLSVKEIPGDKMQIHKKFKWTYEEKIVSLVFGIAVFLWLTRDIQIKSIGIKGWKNLFEHSEFIDDSLVAIASVILLFIIPSRKNKSEGILTWVDVKQLKYDILLLFGGGFALAYGFEKSGLMEYVMRQLSMVKDMHPLGLIFIIAITVTIVSEFASNIASVQLALPVVAALSVHFSQEMTLKLMLPCVLSASVGFMLPVATAPNTIAFGSGKVSLPGMYKAGFWLDVFSIFTISIYCYFIL
ncbi:MAG: SLC13 family permease [Bacteroidia bacterium]|nr:MAG: SLC13 family permease [Bacteroidia bacterium]